MMTKLFKSKNNNDKNKNNDNKKYKKKDNNNLEKNHNQNTDEDTGNHTVDNNNKEINKIHGNINNNYNNDRNIDKISKINNLLLILINITKFSKTFELLKRKTIWVANNGVTVHSTVYKNGFISIIDTKQNGTVENI